MSCALLSCLQFSKVGTKGEDNVQSRTGTIGMRTRWVNCCTRTGARIVILICVNEGYTLYDVAPCPPYDRYCCLFDTHCISFEMIGKLMLTTGR